MKSLHAHVSVTDMAESIYFYSAVFGSQPTVLKEDYAKWMLDEPRVNFAISQHGKCVGLSHLDTQVKSAKELLALFTDLPLDVLNEEEVSHKLREIGRVLEREQKPQHPVDSL